MAAKLALGDDPSKELSKKPAITVDDLCTRLIEEHVRVKLKPRSIAVADDIAQRFVRPTLGRMFVDDVKREAIAKLHHEMWETPYQANRVVAFVSKMMNMAELWGVRAQGSNPCRGIQKYKERPRERFLKKDEVKRLFVVLDAHRNSDAVMVFPGQARDRDRTEKVGTGHPALGTR